MPNSKIHIIYTSIIQSLWRKQTNKKQNRSFIDLEFIKKKNFFKKFIFLVKKKFIKLKKKLCHLKFEHTARYSGDFRFIHIRWEYKKGKHFFSPPWERIFVVVRVKQILSRGNTSWWGGWGRGGSRQWRWGHSKSGCRAGRRWEAWRLRCIWD